MSTETSPTDDVTDDLEEIEVDLSDLNDDSGSVLRDVKKVFRVLFVLIGLAEVVAPRRTVDTVLDKTTKGDESGAKEWVYQLARIDGIATLIWVVVTEAEERLD
ncbi:MAG: hypothetical protein ABEK59_10440 [Halobacteria archaeon]